MKKHLGVWLIWGICMFWGASEARSERASLHAGEWMRFRAQARGIEGGYLTLELKKIRKMQGSRRLAVKMHARTNSFFDKIYRINNIFESWFVLSRKGSFRSKVSVEQSGWRQRRTMRFSPNSVGRREALLRRRKARRTRHPKKRRLRISRRLRSGAKKLRPHLSRVALRKSRRAKRRTPSRRWHGVRVQVPRRQHAAKLAQQKRYWSRKQKVWGKTYRYLHYVPLDTHDLAGLLYYTRTLPLRVGRRYRTHLFAVNSVWRAEAVVKRKRRVSSVLGVKRAFELHASFCKLQNPKRCHRLKVWISADRARVPLKIEGKVYRIGRVSAELIEYRRSYRSAMRRRKPRRSPLLFGRSF